MPGTPRCRVFCRSGWLAVLLHTEKHTHTHIRIHTPPETRSGTCYNKIYQLSPTTPRKNEPLLSKHMDLLGQGLAGSASRKAALASANMNFDLFFDTACMALSSRQFHMEGGVGQACGIIFVKMECFGTVTPVS